MEGTTFSLFIQKPPLFIFLWIILSRNSPLFQKNIPLLEALKQYIYLKYFHRIGFFLKRNLKIGRNRPSHLH